MSAGAEGNETPDADHSTATITFPSNTVGSTAPPRRHHSHHVLLDPEEDRWRWRRRIRQKPRKLLPYRIAVAIAVLLLICLGIISGLFAGWGGMPLVLRGLSMWLSEFEWGCWLMQRLKRMLRR